MQPTIGAATDWIQRRSENLIAAMLGVMFAAFVLQIVFRYFFNLPTGWSTELTVVMWLWMVLWGSAFALKESDEIRFDLVYSSAPPRVRRVMGAIVAVAIIALYGLSLPGSFDYVAFMKVERSSYLKIRLDWLYSVYVIFLVSIIARYAWLLGRVVRGHDPGAQASSVASGL
jgi:TRAP-type C4-dicarboxylate transport system permease small subunit